MAGQYQTDVIGQPFSGVESKNGCMVVSTSSQLGKRQTKGGVNDVNTEVVHERLKNRLDHAGY